MSMHSITGAFRSENYVDDEIIIKVREGVPIEPLPRHFKDDARAGLLGITVEDDNPIRQLIMEAGYPEPFFSRIFVPADDVRRALRKEQKGAALVLSNISAAYDSEEVADGCSRTYQVKFKKPIDDPRALCAYLREAAPYL